MIGKRLLLLLAIPGALALPGTADAGGRFITNGSSVAVYDVNVGQMAYTWKEWAAEIKRQEGYPVPDVILGQDFKDDADIDTFKKSISNPDEGFGVDYSWRQSNYSSTNPNRRVIFWRTSRFTLASVARWQGWGGGRLEPCQHPASNAEAVQVRLYDTQAGKYVSAVSMKTPPKDTLSECAFKNAQLAGTKMNAVGAGDMQLIGMDTNATDYLNGSYDCWWRATVSSSGTTCYGTNLGWSDVIYAGCGGLRSCLDANPTRFNTRIDYIFARASGLNGAMTREEKTLGLTYQCKQFSDHCSVRAVVSYWTSF